MKFMSLQYIFIAYIIITVNIHFNEYSKSPIFILYSLYFFIHSDLSKNIKLNIYISPIKVRIHIWSLYVGTKFQYIMYDCISCCSYYFFIGDHCSCFSDDRFQPNTAILKSDGSDVYAYILCTWWSGVATTKASFKLQYGHFQV